MNTELIDEIAFNSGCQRNSYHDPRQPDLDGFIINRETLDKFAEEIIKECIQVCDSSQNKYPYLDRISIAIKDRFGIENDQD